MPMGVKIPFKPSKFSTNMGFGRGAFKKFGELKVLAGFISLGASMAAGFTFYSLYQKPDVRVNKMNDVAPWDRIDYKKPQKFLTFQQKWEEIPEVKELKKDVGPQKW